MTPITILAVQKYITESNSPYWENVSTMDYIYPLFLKIPIAYACLYITKWLIRQEEPDFSAEDLDNGQVAYSYDKIPNSKRFTHFVFDWILVYLLILPVISNLILNLSSVFLSLRFQWMNSSQSFYFVVGSATLLYYTIFEGFFRASPIKFITGTSVIKTTNMNPPSFGTIVIRSISRRIPFEPFSFFGKQGWHDSISGTDVIAIKKEGQINFKHGLWAYLFFGVCAMLVAIPIIKKTQQKNKTNRLSQKAALYQKKASLENLNEGDILVFQESSTQSYRRNQVAVIVDEVSDTQITGTLYSLDEGRIVVRESYLNKKYDHNDWKAQDPVSLEKSKISDALLNEGKTQTFDFNESTYALKTIEDIDHPKFHCSSSGGRVSKELSTYGYTVEFDVCPVRILDIEVLEGDVEWTSEMPLSARFSYSNAQGSFRIESSEKGSNQTKSRIKLSYKGQEHNYIIFKYESTFKMVKELTNEE
jgi:hypothetical protein